MHTKQASCRGSTQQTAAWQTYVKWYRALSTQILQPESSRLSMLRTLGVLRADLTCCVHITIRLRNTASLSTTHRSRPNGQKPIGRWERDTSSNSKRQQCITVVMHESAQDLANAMQKKARQGHRKKHHTVRILKNRSNIDMNE